MVPEEDVPNAVSLNSALMTSSRVIGPALAGLLITTVGFGWAFVGDGLSYLAVLAALAMMRTAELRPPVPATRGKGQVREGLRYVRRTPVLFVPLVMMTVIGTLAFNFQVVFPLFVTRDLGGSDATFTILLSVISVGSLVGALATARRRHIDVRSVGLAAVAFGVPLGVLAISPNLATTYLVGALVGFGSIAFLTSSTAIVQVEADPSMRGRVLALQGMVFLGSTPIGGPILGWISERWGARWGIALGAVACLAAAAWGLAAAHGTTGAPLEPAAAEASAADAQVELAGRRPLHPEGT
jgi:predicted MFS family arabinose efflux permease